MKVDAQMKDKYFLASIVWFVHSFIWFFKKFIYVIIFGCVESSLLHMDFL